MPAVELPRTEVPELPLCNPANSRLKLFDTSQLTVMSEHWKAAESGVDLALPEAFETTKRNETYPLDASALACAFPGAPVGILHCATSQPSTSDVLPTNIRGL